MFKNSKTRPMNLIIFVSGSGGNLNAAIELAKTSNLIRIIGVVSDRKNIQALKIAKLNNITTITYEFKKICGASNYPINSQQHKEYKECCEVLHNKILFDIQNIEIRYKITIDLLVLSYHRIISGELLHYFDGRIINQHPADLTILDEENSRKYINMHGLEKSIENMEPYTRTSTILINKGIDEGSILAQGEKIRNTYNKNIILKEYVKKHEDIQKKKSDWGVLKFVLKEISLGNYTIIKNEFYKDGSNKILYKNKLLPYGGIKL